MVIPLAALTLPAILEIAIFLAASSWVFSAELPTLPSKLGDEADSRSDRDVDETDGEVRPASPVLGGFGDHAAVCLERREAYAAYVRLKDAEDAKLFSGSAMVIGDDEFKAKVRSNSGRLTSRRVGRPRKSQ